MITPQEADILSIPLLDGAVSWAQVIAPPDGDVVMAVSCRKGSKGDAPHPFVPIDIVAFVRCKPEHLASSTWSIAGFEAIPDVSMFFDTDHHTQDLPPIDPAIIEGFINAWHGLYPWDAFDQLFDQIAANGVNKTRVPS